MSPSELLAMILFLGITYVILKPVAAAVAKRIAGEHRRPGMEPDEREEIMAELQQVRHEISELAERMDFAERLLAKPRDAGRS